MRDPDLSARAGAGYAADRLQAAWQHWRARHGFRKPADPPTSYVGCSLAAPMGQPRVVMGIDAAEALRFADFLDRREGLCTPGPAPASSGGRPADAPVMSPPAAVIGRHATEAEYPVRPDPVARAGAIRAFEQLPARGTQPMRVMDPVSAEIDRWTQATGE